MGMDDQYRQMVRFSKALEAFNHELKTVLRELDEKHDTSAPLGLEEANKQRELEWLRLHDLMKQYTAVEGPRFVEVLHSKLRFLERYLYGG